HLHKIAENVDHFDINQPDKELKLDRKGNSASNRDELDLLVDAFNKLQKQLKLLFSSMEKEVEHRTKELIASKEEAIRANSAKTEFLSQMSHELRTPMNAVLGFAQLLEMDESLNQIQKENAGEILIAGNHLLELINEVLDLSKIESGKPEIILEPILIYNVIMESVSLVRPLLEKKNIRLTWDSHKKNNWTISAERFRLKEVIINLLSNAIKYNSNNGEIIINCEVHDDVLRLNISDTGPGLSAEQQQQIFEPFNRAGAENTSIEGAGIGLTITKRLTHLMGGEIGVISNVGSGCCFFVEFKLIEA
ncbi:MAG TPA: HAMP domain-containing histidine kinase, partial [Gammaproteobacteria bacterium]|nr:HAMP domain-containing histidine kinase [Gammaproteobacteria bacterium]